VTTPSAAKAPKEVSAPPKAATHLEGASNSRAETPPLDPVLSNFLSFLDVRLQRIAQTPDRGTDAAADTALAQEASNARQAGLKDISDALVELKRTDWTNREYESWNQAYRLERLLVLHEPSQYLWSELKRRLAQASEENVGTAKRLALAAEALASQAVDPKNPGTIQTGSDTIVRSLLLETLEETHSTKQRKFLSRPIRREATTRIVWLGLAAFALFMLPYLVLYLNLLRHEPVNISSWAWLPIYSAATTGLFGALFSRLLYLQSNWNALTIGGLKDARDYASILLRGSVGLIGAVIVFFFLKSGIISGGLFPDFEKIGIEGFKFPPTDNVVKDAPVSFQLYYPTKSWALLVVWSFLAGFSERLVASKLRETESSFRSPPTAR